MDSLGDGWITRASRLKKLKTGELSSSKGKSAASFSFNEEGEEDGEKTDSVIDPDELGKALEDVKRKRSHDDDGVFRKVKTKTNERVVGIYI